MAQKTAYFTSYINQSLVFVMSGCSNVPSPWPLIDSNKTWCSVSTQNVDHTFPSTHTAQSAGFPLQFVFLLQILLSLSHWYNIRNKEIMWQAPWSSWQISIDNTKNSSALQWSGAMEIITWSHSTETRTSAQQSSLSCEHPLTHPILFSPHSLPPHHESTT